MSALRLPSDLLGEIRRHAAFTYPEECCGVLIGVPGNASAAHRVHRIVPSHNQREDGSRHHRFLIDPATILAAQKTARRDGLEIVGYYHSHPDHPSAPSEFDRDHAWPDTSYLIVSVAKGVAQDQRSWRLADDRSHFDEENVEVVQAAV